MASEHRRWDARAVDDVGIHAGCMAADYHARQAAADLVRRLQTAQHVFPALAGRLVCV